MYDEDFNNVCFKLGMKIKLLTILPNIMDVREDFLQIGQAVFSEEFSNLQAAIIEP